MYKKRTIMSLPKSYFILTVLGISGIALVLIFTLMFKKQNLFDIGINAYIYAYPLVLMDTTQKIMTREGRYKNIFINVSEFPTDTFKNIVRPNVDTLYSFAWLDLVEEPLILSVPDTHDRYYLVEFLDAWTNVFASVGKRTTGTSAKNFIIIGPVWKGDRPEGMPIIHAPTNMVLLLARTQTYGKSDYEYIHHIQEGYTLTPLHKWGKPVMQPVAVLNAHKESEQQAPVDLVGAMDASTFYTIFAQALKNNPPALSDGSILRQLKKIGIEPGENFNAKSDPGLIAALDSSIKSAYEKIINKKNDIQRVNGWGVMLNIGTYGTDYLLRAMVAYLGIGANLPEDAIYPTAFVDADNNPLNGKNRYRINFAPHQLPPVNAFWSVTLYNSESFLVNNSLNRYSLNDRDPLVFNTDGSLDIYIQHESPGMDKEPNWLPAPEDEFNITMRLYWPKEAVLEGIWQPPAIEKVA